MSDYAFGIDLSKYQCSHGNDSKLVDFDAIAAHSEKVSFIFARASLSYGYVDPRYAYYKAESARIGVPFGSYHYCYPAAPYASQMATFLGVVRPDEHTRLALDLENAQGMTRTQITNWTISALEYVKTRTGRYPMIYSRATWVNPYLDVARLPAGIEWWLADYAPIPAGAAYAPEQTPPPRLPAGVTNWLIHQTGGYTPPLFNVASRTLDYDRWNGDEAAVRAYFGYTGEEPEPPEPPDPTEPLFEGIVTADPYLNIREYPTTQSADLGDLFPGRRLNVYEIVPNWYRMRTVDEPYQAGWVASAYVARDWDGAVLDVPLFSQNDPLWRYEKLGTSASTIGGYGCLLTCAAMNCLYFGKATNPHFLNQAMVRVNGYANGNLWKWWSLPAVYPDLEVRDWVNCEKVPAPLERIDNALAAGNPVIVMVDYRPGGTIQMHFVLIVGKADDDYVINDPIDGKQVSFRSRYGDPVSGIYRIAVYARRGQ